MKQFVVRKGDRKFTVFAEDKISAISKLKDNVLSNTSEIIRKCSEFIKNFQGSDKSLYVDFETREKRPSNVYVNGKQQDMTIKVELSYEPDDQGGLFFIDCYGYLDGNKMTKIISRTAESKKAMTVLGEVSNKLHQTLKDGGLETLEEEYNYVGKTHDELIQSGSEEALQKNIATEIKAGKDPKQAAAIAYSVQRENDADPDNLRARAYTYSSINSQPWFIEFVKKAVKNSDRVGSNRIRVYFGSEKDAKDAISKLDKRNISHVGILENTLDKTFAVDVFYNFSELRPSRASKSKDVIIDEDIEDSLYNVYDIEYLNPKSVVEHWKTYAETEQEAIKNFEEKFKRMGLSKTSILNVVQINKIEDSTIKDKYFTFKYKDKNGNTRFYPSDSSNFEEAKKELEYWCSSRNEKPYTIISYKEYEDSAITDAHDYIGNAMVFKSLPKIGEKAQKYGFGYSNSVVSKIEKTYNKDGYQFYIIYCMDEEDYKNNHGTQYYYSVAIKDLNIVRDSAIRDSKIVLERNKALDIFEDIEEDRHWYQSNYNLDFDLRDHYLTISGNRSNLERLARDYHLSDYNIIIKDNAINDIDGRLLTQSAKELKEELGLARKVIGSHLSKGIREYKPRQNQFNNKDVAEVNEAINDAIRYIDQGFGEESYRRLEIDLDRIKNTMPKDTSSEEYKVLSKVLNKGTRALNAMKQYLNSNKDSNTITDAEIPHITKEQWNKIPKDYKHVDPKTGKKMAFAGSLGIAPGGTTLLTEGMHFIIDSEEKNYTYIMFGTTGEKRVDNLTKAEAEHLLKNNKLLGYGGKVVETKELGDDITTQQYFTDISDKFDLSKYTNDPETVETQSGGTSIIELSEDDEYNVKLVEALKNAGYRKVASYKFVKDTECNIKDAYYNIGGYKSETDNMLKQDISKARSYGLKTYVEKVDGSYQLTVEGSRDKVEKIVEDYFAGDVSSIGDKQVFSEETMNSVQRGIEKDYENMNKDLEELHDTSAPKEIEDLPLKARQEMKNAKEKGSKLLEILSQLQDIVNKASVEEKAEVKYKAEKILADLKKQFGLEKETYIKLDSAIKDGTIYGITPLFKWKKGNKKPERVEYSLESARYVKNSLERNDRIPYVIFELDTYRIVDSIQDDDKEKIKLKNELETLKSELKSNNRKYWKISEINEKEDRIVELERRIAELES